MLVMNLFFLSEAVSKYPGPRGFSCFFSAWESLREPRSGEQESRRGEKEKPLQVTLDLNLTFMQTPAVKRVKLIITKRTNGNSARTCLSATNQSN